MCGSVKKGGDEDADAVEEGDGFSHSCCVPSFPSPTDFLRAREVHADGGNSSTPIEGCGSTRGLPSRRCVFERADAASARKSMQFSVWLTQACMRGCKHS